MMKRNIQHILFTLLLLVAGMEAWGQTDYSGTYYIASVGYNSGTPANNYYLCPTEGWCYYKADDDFWPSNTEEGNKTMPFLTTYQCRSAAYHSGDASDAVWEIEKAPDPDYYYIKQVSTGKYLTSNGQISNAGKDRMRVHLENVASENLSDKQLFTITAYSTYLTISPKGVEGSASANKWLVVNGGNKPSLVGESGKTGGPTGYTNTAGIIGVFTQNDGSAPFYLEIPSPTISQDPSTLNISISSDWTGVIIRYTTDGTEPTKTSTLYEGEFLPTIGVGSVKAKAFNSSGDVASATTTFELTKNASPSISVNMGAKEATISTTVDGGIIYYTTNGTNPTVSSSVYSAPISFSKPTTIKAIVGKEGYAPSTVTTKNIIKVGTPTIYDNGNVAIAITTATTGASIYYTTDGSMPTRSSSPYSVPLTNMEGKTIKAFAVKADNFDSDVATFGPVSFSCSQPIIRRTGADKFTVTCPKPC